MSVQGKQIITIKTNNFFFFKKYSRFGKGNTKLTTDLWKTQTWPIGIQYRSRWWRHRRRGTP